MPSLRVLGLSLAIIVQLVATKPLADQAIATADCEPLSNTKPAGATPILPLTGATELPSTNLTLVAVAIGRGIQNYTCATASSVPVALGALATLFDATALAYSNENLLNTLPGVAVNLPLPSSGVLATAGGHFNVLGHHYFDSTGTPTFNLSTINKIGFVLKKVSISAPTSANKGPAGTGAVPWLYLIDHVGYTSVGISQVYRVETAGETQRSTVQSWV